MGAIAEALESLKKEIESLEKGEILPVENLISMNALLADNENVKISNLSSETKEKWAKFIGGGSVIFSNRDLRKLFWHWDAVISEKFLSKIRVSRPKLRKTEVAGLVFSCANKWSQVEDNISAISAIKRVILEICNENELDLDLGPLEALNYAKISESANEIVSKELISVGEALNRLLKIDILGTELFSKIQEYIAVEAAHLAESEDTAKVDFYFNKVLFAIEDKTVFIKALSKILKGDTVRISEEHQEIIADKIRKDPNLGDPRLPGAEGLWIQVPADVKTAIKEWFSRRDIKIFFQVLFERQNDHQGRQSFWEPYAYAVVNTQIIISSDLYEDKYPQLSKVMDDPGALPTLYGQGSKGAAAFVMDFGKFIVVEFSVANNACYVYEKDPNFHVFDVLKKDEIDSTDLKNTRNNTWRASHGDGWEHKFANFFDSKYGIKPRFNK